MLHRPHALQRGDVLREAYVDRGRERVRHWLVWVALPHVIAAPIVGQHQPLERTDVRLDRLDVMGIAIQAGVIRLGEVRTISDPLPVFARVGAEIVTRCERALAREVATRRVEGVPWERVEA